MRVLTVMFLVATLVYSCPASEGKLDSNGKKVKCDCAKKAMKKLVKALYSEKGYKMIKAIMKRRKAIRKVLKILRKIYIKMVKKGLVMLARKRTVLKRLIKLAKQGKTQMVLNNLRWANKQNVPVYGSHFLTEGAFPERRLIVTRIGRTIVMKGFPA